MSEPALDPLEFEPINPDNTLRAARDWLDEHVADGVTCPCCGQFAKEYVRKLNRGMAEALIRMFLVSGSDWQDKTLTLKGFGPAARDESLLRHWGLLEEDHRPRADGGRAGWWRVTGRGAEFVLGRITVLSHVRLYDNEFRGLEGHSVVIDECLGEGFHRAELLATVRRDLGVPR